MSQRKERFVTGEIYHCYNRGVDKRDVFIAKEFLDYYEKICCLFNQPIALGGVKESQYHKNNKNSSTEHLVTILSYCFNPNHYHLVIRQETDDGITKFMQKIGTGFTMYFNKQNERSGALFQGKFKSKYVNSDQYLKNLLVYVNRNNELHGINDLDRIRRSHELYVSNSSSELCDVAAGLEYYEEGEYLKSQEGIFRSLKSNKEEQKMIEFTEARPT